MLRRKILAIILSAFLIITAGCDLGGGTTSVGSVPPPPSQLTLDPATTILCLGNAAANFADIGQSSSDDNVLVKIAWDTIQSLFAQSCQTTVGSALTLIQQKLDPTTYVYVGPGTEEHPQLNFNPLMPPVDVANCTSSPTSSDFYLGTPLWISVANPDTQLAVIFQSVDFPQTTPGVVARYLDNQYLLQFNAFTHRQYYGSTTVLQPDEYVEYYVPFTSITYETGIYEVYSGGRVIKGPAQWSFVKDITFPTELHGTAYFGAHAKGLCASV
jgi:hypothetical protein